MTGTRITNTILAALRFYQEEEMAATAAELAVDGETEALSYEEINNLCDKISKGDIEISEKPEREVGMPVAISAPYGNTHPNTELKEMIELLSECEEAVEYYHEREGCPLLRASLKAALATPPTHPVSLLQLLGETPKTLQELRDLTKGITLDELQAQAWQLVHGGKAHLGADWKLSLPKLEEPKQNPEEREAREKAAVTAFEDYDFGDFECTDQDGWTRDGKYWSKRVYGDTPEGRQCLSFGVEFGDHDSEVVETWSQKIA